MGQTGSVPLPLLVSERTRDRQFQSHPANAVAKVDCRVARLGWSARVHAGSNRHYSSRFLKTDRFEINHCCPRGRVHSVCL